MTKPTMTVADVANALRSADIGALTTPQQQDDVLVMIDFLRQQTLNAIDETAKRVTALDRREEELAKREAALAARQAAVDRIMAFHATVPTEAKPRRWGW